MGIKRRAVYYLSCFGLPGLVVLLSIINVTAGTAQVESELSAFRVIAGQNGKEELIPADRATPGEVIAYVLICTNKGTTPVDNLQPTLPIPLDTEYMPGTARPSVILASLDGKVFALAPLKRTVKGADGKIREEAIPYREYRFIRWRLGRLDPGKGATVKARVRITSANAENK